MKKYFPIVVSIMIFTGFLSLQIVFDLLNTSARRINKDKQLHVHYENIFKKTVLRETSGKTIDFSKISTPIVLINFWASWCLPCLEEIPSLVELDEKYGSEKLLIIGINTDEEKPFQKIEKKKKQFNIHFPIVPDTNGEILNNFLVSSIPTTLIFHQGKVVKTIHGAEDFMSVENIEIFNNLLKQ